MRGGGGGALFGGFRPPPDPHHLLLQSWEIDQGSAAGARQHCGSMFGVLVGVKGDVHAPWVRYKQATIRPQAPLLIHAHRTSQKEPFYKTHPVFRATASARVSAGSAARGRGAAV